MYNQQRLAMPDYFPVASSSSAVMQAQSQPNYDAYAAAPNVGIPPMQHRASSGAWTPQDDQTLLAARAQGLNWAQIQITYFGNKTPNACRKRHERLMERKGADDWDNRKLERLAKEYMSMRRHLCMSNGLKNLQSAARSAAGRERLESGQPLPPGYDDDSGISGIGLTPVDELDPSYSSPETASSGGHSASGESNGYASQHHQHHHQHFAMQPMPGSYYGHHHQQQNHHGTQARSRRTVRCCVQWLRPHGALNKARSPYHASARSEAAERRYGHRCHHQQTWRCAAVVTMTQ
ncbi:conserved hypothetical protein [Verticillium alfalfae VaMs.102]|uniref:Myb-like domain-containing protein n=1 Tax=Verticillium alfalfae (strain VaMs.102 / ATCC MYA-4576 / FGSC 10136) TaxID=526221 RepID=C9SQ69_VERA1|nr:conserved hypothetical protein [Verticillium alfalfae VaMs.102]EEY20994.1 conserved hypothetical protein [Verticillium alfalfae VaMs.102]